MSTFAILGATGRNGNTILNTLAHTVPDGQINVLVRSSLKLREMSPDLCNSGQVHIFEGKISDIERLQACITDTKAVFLAVAASDNMPGCRIAQDQAEAVVAALSRIRSDDSTKELPRLVMLSSAETEFKFCQSIPWPIRNILYAANANIYEDLILAEKYLRKQSSWINSVIVKPGGLSHDEPSGHRLSLDEQQTFLSYEDLAAGMVEIALEDGGKWNGKNVSVLANRKARVAWEAPSALGKGLLVYVCPWLYSWLY